EHLDDALCFMALLARDRHVKDASRDPQMDSSQDYRLLLGYENKTHTVLRFSRRYDTCDPRDLKITVGDAIYAARKAQDNFLRSTHKARAREIYTPRLSCTIFAEINAPASPWRRVNAEFI
ncbi:MOXD1-like protein, partial [Ooceraea biroi]